MNPLYLLLVVLLGLLGPSMSADPRQLALNDVSIINPDNGDDALSQGLADHQNFPRALTGMILGYQLVCTKDPNTDPPQGMKPGKLLSDKFCRDWSECKPDGTKSQKKEIPPKWNKPAGPHVPTPRTNVKWCKDNCRCELMDQPAEHVMYNIGCPAPYGGYVQGSYGSVARDTAGSSSDDGLVMEAFDGPPRKE